jgi:hypothetical protein
VERFYIIMGEGYERKYLPVQSGSGLCIFYKSGAYDCGQYKLTAGGEGQFPLFAYPLIIPGELPVLGMIVKIFHRYPQTR